MIYLDNAATSLRRPERVVQAVSEALCSLGNVGRGVNAGSLSAARVVYGAREKLSAFFGGDDPSRVCFTCNSTEALNIAIFGLLGPGDHILSTDLEHNSVLRPLYRLENAGAELSFLTADRRGCVDYDALPGLLRPNTRAIVCTHASNLTGNALDIRRIGAFAREHGLLFILDASQTAGSFPISVAEDGISVLCFTGHKGLMAPQGTGGLVIARGVEIRPFKTGGTGVQSHLREQPAAYPTRLEAGTLNGHGIAGLSAALPGVIASFTCKPVIGVPASGSLNYDALLSIVQMPPGIPVAAVGMDRGDNAATLAVEILAVSDKALAQKLCDDRKAMAAKVEKDSEFVVEEAKKLA